MKECFSSRDVVEGEAAVVQQDMAAAKQAKHTSKTTKTKKNKKKNCRCHGGPGPADARAEAEQRAEQYRAKAESRTSNKAAAAAATAATAASGNSKQKQTKAQKQKRHGHGKRGHGSHKGHGVTHTYAHGHRGCEQCCRAEKDHVQQRVVVKSVHSSNPGPIYPLRTRTDAHAAAKFGSSKPHKRKCDCCDWAGLCTYGTITTGPHGRYTKTKEAHASVVAGRVRGARRSCACVCGCAACGK